MAYSQSGYTSYAPPSYNNGVSYSPINTYQSSYNSQSQASRFNPSSFQYNGRVALALLPCLAVLADYGGMQTAGVLMVGFMGVYILDALRFKEGAFAAVWATLGLANLSTILSTLERGSEEPIVLTMMIFFINAAVLFLTGLWATLQFKWIQLQYPAVVMAFEKMLIVGCMPVGAMVQTWGVGSSSGMSTAPFALAILLCCGYYLFSMPLKSSFKLAPRRPSSASAAASSKQQTIQTGLDGFLNFALLLATPAATYSAIHASAQAEWVHFWSLLLLLSGPLLFVTTLRDGLWWAGSDAAIDALRRLILLASLAVFLAGIEGRVVFYSFAQYIRLAAPWSYVAITVTVYGVAALVLLHFSGALGEDTTAVLLGPILMISASVGSLAAGLPIWVLPAPLLSAAGLAMYYETHSLRDYFLFTVGAMVAAGWLVWHHFWFLDVILDDIHLRTLCVLLLVAAGPAFLLPGLIRSRRGRAGIAPLLLLQAGLLCVIEEHLYAGDHAAVTFNIHPMLPAYMVVATSALGLLMARKLQQEKIIGDVAAYMLQCIYGAKLVMLVLPDARLTIPVLGVALAASPPLLLHRDEPHRNAQLQPWQGLGLALAVVVAVLAARFAVFDVLVFLLNRRPSEALALGVLILCAAFGCMPLLMRYYKGAQGPKRLLVLAITAGMLLVFLRPPLPIRGGARCPHLPAGLCPRLWNEDHIPEHEQDDVAIYGDGLRRREHWPLWLLAGAAFFGLAAVTSPSPARQIQPMRLTEALIAAVLVGGYMALEFFFNMFMLQCVIVASAVLAAFAVVVLQVPAKGGAVLLPLLGLLWAGALPLALAIQAITPLPPLPADAHRLFPDVDETELDQERSEAIKTAILATFAAESLLLAFALKLRVAAAAAGERLPKSTRSFAEDAAMIDQAASFLGNCMPTLPGAAKPRGGYSGPAHQRLSADGMSWVPTACNLVTLQCFGLCVVLNVEFTGSSNIAILLLGPILLLLCQDPILLSGLTDRQRYFPPVFGVIACLVGSTAMALLRVSKDEGVFSTITDMSAYVVKNGLLLVACLPTLVDLLWTLWQPSKMSVGRVILPGLLLILPGMFGNLESLRVLVGVAAVGVLFMATNAAFTKQAGRKLI